MMIPRQDLLTEQSPSGLRVFQLTAEEIPSCHVYMEAQIFTPDSKRFVLHRSAHAHGSDPGDPEHGYLLCDIENGGELIPLTDELAAKAPSISPGGQYMYYFVDETKLGGGRLILKRVGLDGTEREVLFALDTPLPGTRYRPTHLYPLSTISSDGLRLAISGFLGDGQTENAPWGLVIFDLRKPGVELVLEGPTWCNLHPQYSRSLDDEASHDVLIQENHGCVITPVGGCEKLTGGAGADIHVIRDDGTNLRDMPWGRDGNEFCQGHQCWRGRSSRAITSTENRARGEQQLIKGSAAAPAGHVGINTPGSRRNDLSRDFPEPHFYHFGTDINGNRLITDCGPKESGGALYVADLPADENGPLENVRFLLNARSSWQKETHIHPFLSPDGTMGFFNSDESGVLQAYMVRGF